MNTFIFFTNKMGITRDFNINMPGKMNMTAIHPEHSGHFDHQVLNLTASRYINK